MSGDNKAEGLPTPSVTMEHPREPDMTPPHTLYLVVRTRLSIFVAGTCVWEVELTAKNEGKLFPLVCRTVFLYLQTLITSADQFVIAVVSACWSGSVLSVVHNETSLTSLLMAGTFAKYHILKGVISLTPSLLEVMLLSAASSGAVSTWLSSEAVTLMMLLL